MRYCKVILFFGLFVACSHSFIKGTKVRDTKENREVIAVLEKLKDALEKRDADAILELVSPHYFEDMGTPEAKDDFGYTEFKEKILTESLAVAKEVSVNFQIYAVKIEEDKAFIDIRYNTRAKLEFPSSSEWKTLKDFDRVELIREEGSWRIVRGL